MLVKIKAFLFMLAEACLSFLPDSPLSAALSKIGSVPYLGYINYFIPIDVMIGIAELWLVAIGIFYTYQALMRFSNLID